MKTYEKPVMEVFASMAEPVLGFGTAGDNLGNDGGIGGGFAKRQNIIMDDEYLSEDISFSKNSIIEEQ